MPGHSPAASAAGGGGGLGVGGDGDGGVPSAAAPSAAAPSDAAPSAEPSAAAPSAASPSVTSPAPPSTGEPLAVLVDPVETIVLSRYHEDAQAVVALQRRLALGVWFVLARLTTCSYCSSSRNSIFDFFARALAMLLMLQCYSL